MKILIAADTYYPHVNGASYFTQRLAQALSLRGHTVAVVAPGTSSRFVVTKQKDVTFFEVPSFPMPFIWNFRFTIPGFVSYHVEKVLSEFDPDIIHMQMHFMISRTTLNRALRRNIPVVATNHFMPDNLTFYLHLPKFIENKINELAWQDCARVLTKAHEITSPSPQASELLSKYVLKEIHAISNGIDIQQFYPRIVGNGFKEKYNLPDRFLLFVGRLDKEKNIDVVIRAMALVQDKSIHFVVAGHGNDRPSLETLMRTLSLQGRVHFLGFVPDEDLPDLYAAAKCFINMGTAELQSIVTMEAMATHLPVIGANAVALPALIRSGENGFLVEAGDVEGAARAISEIFVDEPRRRRMGEMSFKYVQRHEINYVLSQYEDLYAKLLARQEIV